MTESTRDVAVIGAGPAGAWAAYRLAAGGVRVLLADGSHPREKPCGGGVTARALALVAGAPGLERLDAVTIRSARFVDSRTGRSATVAFEPEQRSALVVSSRTHLDECLVQAAVSAGAEWLPTRVADVERAGSAFRLRTAAGSVIVARTLIGADGANSLVRRRLAAAFRRDQLSIATGYFAHGVTSDEILIELTPDPPGYLWSFPRPDHLAVGICAPADRGISSPALRARTGAWITATGASTGARLEPYAWPIPSLSAHDLACLEPAGTGWFLVGDAAGLVDPLTREGIYFALRSADFAADEILRDRSGAAEAFTRRVRREIAADLARAAQFKAGFFRPAFTSLLLDAAGSSEPIRRVLADLIAGTQPYRGLKWRLAKTFEVGLALRALGWGT